VLPRGRKRDCTPLVFTIGVDATTLRCSAAPYLFGGWTRGTFNRLWLGSCLLVSCSLWVSCKRDAEKQKCVPEGSGSAAVWSGI